MVSLKYSEKEIIEALRKKEEEAYCFLFDEYFERMVWFAEYFLLDRKEGEDIVQEVFLKLWHESRVLDIRTNLKTYLFSLVRNACLNRIKHLHIEDRHKQLLAEAQLYAEIPDIELDPVLVKKIYAAIDELPEQARIIFKRCVIDGKKYKEVAEEMGISVNTINTQMKRAYKYLRERLQLAFLIFLMSL